MFCRELPAEELSRSAPGTYGDILATFNHLITADGGYLGAPADAQPAWARDGVETTDLDELIARVDETAGRWERFLSEPPDADRVLTIDAGALEVRQGVMLTQALHHGNAHREQICSIITALGHEPPGLQAWEWAEATGRIWPTDRS